MTGTPFSLSAALPDHHLPAAARGASATHELVLRGLATAAPLSLFRQLDGSPRGLLERDATERLARVGPNQLPTDTTPSAAARLRAALSSPFVLLLAGLGCVFVVLGDARGWATVGTMVLASVALRWSQHVRSDRAMRRLRSRVRATVAVRRRATRSRRPVEREVPVDDVVPGDVLVLSAGDLVPADARIITAHQLRVDQSVLSGEQSAVAKHAPSGTRRSGSTTSAGRRRAGGRAVPEVLDLASICFAGTSVVSGSGIAVVIATGRGTWFGALAEAASADRPRSTVEHGVRAVGWTLTRFMLVLVPIVFAVNGAVGQDWVQAALFAVAVAVGLTPEMLPVIVTATLARGARRLARREVLVKRLDAIGDLGGMDVLCLDKTGTLTEDRVVLTHSVDVDGELDDAAAEHAFLVTRFGSGPRSAVDDAVADHVGDGQALLVEALYEPVDELGFDHERRRATVVLAHAGLHLTVSVGDPDEILPLCTTVRRAGAPDGAVDLTPQLRRRADDAVTAHQSHGLRIRAVAARTGPVRLRGHVVPDESAMTLIGFVGFLDPVRESTADAVRQLAAHGVAVRVLTGDAPHVAAQVCSRARIPIGEIVLGREIDAASDAELAAVIARAKVFAKVDPQQKARIVGALRGAGHCVGFLGDGVNDTMALRVADVGICVDTASPAARDAADLVLLAPDLATLAHGVVEGRRTLGNTMKYVTITAASNFGNVISVLVAGAVLPFLPMLPLQLMVQNLLYDAAQLALPWDRVEPGYLRRPRRWDARGLTRFMLVFGPLSSVFDLVTFGILWWGVGIDSATEQGVFHAVWFCVGLLSQVLVVLVLRGYRLRMPAWPVLAATAVVAVVAVVLPFSPLGAAVLMVAPPPAFLPWLLLVVGAYLITAQLVKVVVVRRTRRWL